jgi:hypothetical protein
MFTFMLKSKCVTSLHKNYVYPRENYQNYTHLRRTLDRVGARVKAAELP